MTGKIPTDDSEEVYSSQFINDENEPITVRYNALAYERKLEQQIAQEQPITQRAVPKQ